MKKENGNFYLNIFLNFITNYIFLFYKLRHLFIILIKSFCSLGCSVTCKYVYVFSRYYAALVLFLTSRNFLFVFLFLICSTLFHRLPVIFLIFNVICSSIVNLLNFLSILCILITNYVYLNISNFVTLSEYFTESNASLIMRYNSKPQFLSKLFFFTIKSEHRSNCIEPCNSVKFIIVLEMSASFSCYG